MRIVSISLFAAATLVATPALAQASEGNPVGGVGVSVETSPGGIIATFGSEAEARNACTASGGTYTSNPGRIVCSNPGPQYAGRKGRGIAVARGGGSFSTIQRNTVAPSDKVEQVAVTPAPK